MANLNLSNYTTTMNADFTTSSSLSDFPLFWDNNGSVSFDGDGVTLSAGSGGAVGFLQAYGGQTYGLYQVTARLDAGQGNGAAVVLWPGDNVWPGPEVDLLESFDTSRQTAYTTIHHNDNGNDSYDSHNFTIDATQWHTYAYDWEPGRLTYYADGQELFTTTSNVPSSSLEFGAEIAAPSGTVDLHIKSMSISQPNGGTATDQTQASPTTPADTSPAPAQANTPTPTSTPATPSSISVSQSGANGDQVTAQVSAPGLSSVNYAVFTAANMAAGGWTAATLDGNGNATISATVPQGDYLNVTDPSGTVPAAWLASPAAAPDFITVGNGTTIVTGTAGADVFAYPGDGSQDVINNFSATAGDVLQIPTALQGSLQQAQSGGDTVLSFGANAGSITLAGVSSLPADAIRFA